MKILKEQLIDVICKTCIKDFTDCIYIDNGGCVHVHEQADKILSLIQEREKQARIEFVKYILDNIADRAEFDLDWEEVESCLEYGLSELEAEQGNKEEK